MYQYKPLEEILPEDNDDKRSEVNTWWFLGERKVHPNMITSEKVIGQFPRSLRGIKHVKGE